MVNLNIMINNNGEILKIIHRIINKKILLGINKVHIKNIYRIRLIHWVVLILLILLVKNRVCLLINFHIVFNLHQYLVWSLRLSRLIRLLIWGWGWVSCRCLSRIRYWRMVHMVIVEIWYDILLWFLFSLSLSFL